MTNGVVGISEHKLDTFHKKEKKILNKKNRMKKYYFQIVIYAILGLLLFFYGCASTPTGKKIPLREPKSELFVSANSALNNAVSEKAHQLASPLYIKAVRQYLEAEKDLEKGKDTVEIKNKLAGAEELAGKATEVSQLIQDSFPELVKSRNRAIAAGADEMGLKAYEQAEILLQNTACLVEDNDLIEAQEKARKAEKQFQKAELKALQEKIAWTLNQNIKEAEKQGAPIWAPETYQASVRYRDEALKALEQNRYNQDDAQQKVAEGEQYGSKALLLTGRIKRLKEYRGNWEKLFLQREEDFKKIAETLDLDPSFAKDFKEPLAEIDQAIKKLKEKEETLKTELKQAEHSVKELREREKLLEAKLETLEVKLETKEKSLSMAEQKIKQSERKLKEKEQILKAELERAEQYVKKLKGKEKLLEAKLETKLETEEKPLSTVDQKLNQTEPDQEKENIYKQLFQMKEGDYPETDHRNELVEKVKKTEELFSPIEAKVSVDTKDNVTITLYGFTFERNSCSLLSEHYPLLANIKKAARIFPDRKIKITGHSDSVGNKEFNKRLSLDRAKSAAEYLAGELGIQDSRMEIDGVGDSEPIAPNTSPLGRSLNRRIEFTFLAP